MTEQRDKMWWFWHFWPFLTPGKSYRLPGGGRVMVKRPLRAEDEIEVVFQPEGYKPPQISYVN